MLLRQLERPISRSIAAACRPSVEAALICGSSRRGISSSTRRCATPGDDSQPQAHSRPRRTLFEELFPDEAKQRSQPSFKPRQDLSSLRAGSWVSHLQDPGSQTSTATRSSGTDANNTTNPPPHNIGDDLSAYEPPRYFTPVTTPTPDERCMVVLSAASPDLTEADFYRVSATPTSSSSSSSSSPADSPSSSPSSSSRLLPGWVSGIVSVSPARDPDTLDPLGRYHVLFETRSAAEAWRAEVIRLWGEARRRTPGAASGRGKTRQRRDDEELYRAGADAATGPRRGGEGKAAGAAEVEGFTLVLPSQRYDLQLLAARDYTAFEQALEHGGSLVERLCRKAGTKFLVMIVVDGGRIGVDTLRDAIRDDGAERNLPWRVKDLDREGSIMPFGKSGSKPAPGNEDGFVPDSAGAEPIGSAARAPEGGWQKIYPRFLVPFLDEAEARRFVRNWHRRQWTLRTEREDGVWEEMRTLNVSLLW